MQSLEIASAGEKFDFLSKRLEELTEKVDFLVRQRTAKDWYTPAEFAQLIGKAVFTVQSYCRCGRVHANKKGSGRGKHQSWAISHDELMRYERDGLLPLGELAV